MAFNIVTGPVYPLALLGAEVDGVAADVHGVLGHHHYHHNHHYHHHHHLGHQGRRLRVL